MRFDGHVLDGLDRASAHAPRARPQLPAAAAVRQHAACSTTCASRCSTPCAARGTIAAGREIEARCVELLREVGLDDKAQRLPRDLTQVEMRKLELARAMAAEPKLLIADESMAGLTHSEVEDILALLVRLNEHGVTIILIEHIMRAVMSFSRRLVVLVSGRKIADGEPRRGHARSGSGEGLPWPVASPSPASTPPTARCA